MVAILDPDRVTREAIGFFRKSEVPAGWEWVELLSPVNQRLFAVELADALKECTISGDVTGLATLLADWKATAELDAAPEVLAQVAKEKERHPLTRFLNA